MSDIVVLYSMADIILLYTKLTQYHYTKRNKQATPIPSLDLFAMHIVTINIDICNNRNRNTMIVIGLSFSFFCEQIWQRNAVKMKWHKQKHATQAWPLPPFYLARAWNG